MRKKSELFFNLILLPIDFLAVTAAFVLAYIIRVKLEARPVPNPLGIVLFLKIFLLILPIWIFIFALLGLYHLSSLRGRLEEAGKIFAGVSAGTMVLILVDFVGRQPIFPAKAIPIYGYGFSFVLVTLGRQIVRLVQRSLFSLGIGVHQTVILGSGPIAQRIVRQLRDTKTSGYRLLGIIDSQSKAALKQLKFYPNLAAVIAEHGEEGIDEIIQADSALEAKEILEIVDYASSHHLVFKFVPSQFGVYATNSTVGMLAGFPIVEIKQTPLEGWGRIVKRAFDLLAAIAGLIIISPLLVLIGLISKLTDPGPVFYRHRRLSRTGAPIEVYKFRTMLAKYSTGDGYSGQTAEQIFRKLGRADLIPEFERNQKVKDDPRVSPLGRFLRRTSLDELPQLFNVLKGDLSLVGPRPITTSELARYGKGQSAFLALRPGITGLWQTSGRSDVSYDERVKLDIYYVENWSLWLDIKIVLKTILTLFRGRGAY